MRYQLRACNKTADFLRLTTNFIVHLRSQFIYAFALLITMPPFKRINFCQNRPKIELIFTKNSIFYERWWQSPQTPMPSAMEALSPNSQWLNLPLLN